MMKISIMMKILMSQFYENQINENIDINGNFNKKVREIIIVV